MRRFGRTIDPVSLTPRRRRYTLDEANRSLVLVRRIVEDIVTDYSRLVDLQEAIEAAQTHGAFENVVAARDEITRNVQRLQRALEELELMSLELKDWSLGVVDFPSLADGREVRLSWQFGQESIHYWHEVHSPARQTIDTLPVDEPAVTAR
jgi:hypothetical protein